MPSPPDPPADPGPSPMGPHADQPQPTRLTFTNWWDVPADPATGKVRAVAYYRHSAQDKQKNSVEIQQDQIRKWAEKNNVTIVEEFADHGKSGLTADGRPAFTDMMEQVKNSKDFDQVLVLDVSRWGRFQDLDLSASYSAACKEHGKEVVYVNLGMEDDGSPIYPLVVGFERWRSAQYSRELSDKVFKGCKKVAEQGYSSGGPAPFAMHRVMVDEEDDPQQVLGPGEHKAISNFRVKMAPGEQHQVQIIQEIFHWFVEDGLDERQIAGRLNQSRMPSPSGRSWNGDGVRRVLKNRTYAGAVVYNRTGGKLKSPRRSNPPSEWIITDNAYEAIIPMEIFERVQARFAERKCRLGTPEMVERLRAIYAKHGVLTDHLVSADGILPTFGTVKQRLGGAVGTLHQLYASVHTRTRQDVCDLITAQHGLVEVHQDLLIINRQISVCIQPALPLRQDDAPSWLFKADHRPVVDITIGVPLADAQGGEILGYLAMPRLLMPNGWLRLSGSNLGLLTLHGYRGLDFLKELSP